MAECGRRSGARDDRATTVTTRILAHLVTGVSLQLPSRSRSRLRSRGSPHSWWPVPNLCLVSACKNEPVSPELSHLLTSSNRGHSNVFFEPNTYGKTAREWPFPIILPFITHPATPLCHLSYLCNRWPSRWPRWPHRHDLGLVWKSFLTGV